jgi:hypothetical protein
MNRATSLGTMGALALLASGCAETTSAFADGQGEEALAAWTQAEFLIQTVPARGDVLRAWQLPPSSPWSPYEKLTLPSVMATAPESVRLPRLDDIEEVHMADLAAAEVARQGIPPDAAWMVDLRGAASVAFGRTLSQQARESVAVIPTFNNWPAAAELIPAEETLAAMIAMPPALPAPGDVAARPVFLLDSWRLAFKEDVVDDEVTDNRYMLSEADFPSAYELLKAGISHVVYVVADVNDALYEEDDLNALFLAYQAAGIEIHMVDLSQLIGVREPVAVGGGGGGYVHWYVYAGNRFYVRPRTTIVHDKWFYRRAHGGFGGVHGVPIGPGHAYMFAGGHGGG